MKRKLRVAVIFFGQPRFVEAKLSQMSHRRVLRGAEVEYFGHAWFSDSLSPVQTAPWSGLGEMTLRANAIDIVRDSYPGICLQVEPPQKFEVPDLPNLLGLEIDEMTYDQRREVANLSNTISQLNSIHKALRLADRRNADAPFDLYLLTRYDTVIWAFPHLISIPQDALTLSNHHDAFPDLFFAGPPERVRGVDAFVHLPAILRGATSLVGERLKLRAYLESFPDGALNKVHAPMTIIRSSKPFYVWLYLPLLRLRSILRIRSRFLRLLGSGIHERAITQRGR